MIFALLWEALVITYAFWKWVFPIIARLAMWPVKLSALHLTTLFKGWIPVAQEVAATYLAEGMALGKIPPSPTEWDMKMALMHAHFHIGLGAFLNCFTCFWILMRLIY